MAGKEGGGLDAASWYDSEHDRAIARLTVADTGQPVFLPFRMSCFVISNLIVTAGMLTPGLQVGFLPNINSQLLLTKCAPRQQAPSSGK